MFASKNLAENSAKNFAIENNTNRNAGRKKTAIQNLCPKQGGKNYPKTANPMPVKNLPSKNVARNSARKALSITECNEFLVE